MTRSSRSPPASTAANRRSTSAALRASHARFGARVSCASAASFCVSRAASTTAMPSRAQRRASDALRPDPAPIINARSPAAMVPPRLSLDGVQSAPVIAQILPATPELNRAMPAEEGPISPRVTGYRASRRQVPAIDLAATQHSDRGFASPLLGFLYYYEA